MSWYQGKLQEHSEYESLLSSSLTSLSPATKVPRSSTNTKIHNATYKSTVHRSRYPPPHHTNHYPSAYQRKQTREVASLLAGNIQSEKNEELPLLSSSYPAAATTTNRRHNHRQLSHSNNRSRRKQITAAPLHPSSLSSHRQLYLPSNHSHHDYNRLQHFNYSTQHNHHRDLSEYNICSHGMCCIQCVRTQEIGIVEYFGKFQKLLQPGLHCLPWPFVDVTNRLSLKVQQLDVKCESKTKDNVFVHLTTSILYQIRPTKAYEAHYSLTNPSKQITSHVLDIVRSTIPKLTLDRVFTSSQSDIALEVVRSIQGFMNRYGYDILNVLIGEIEPVEKVKSSMNEIMSAKKWKEGMVHKAEGEKNKKVKAAEAHAETLHLRGIGVSDERKAIAHGLRDAIINFTSSSTNDDGISSTTNSVAGATPKDVMDILVLSHYYDTLASIGSDSVLMHMNPGEFGDLQGQLSTYFATQLQTSNVADIPDFLW